MLTIAVEEAPAAACGEVRRQIRAEAAGKGRNCRGQGAPPKEIAKETGPGAQAQTGEFVGHGRPHETLAVDENSVAVEYDQIDLHMSAFCNRG